MVFLGIAASTGIPGDRPPLTPPFPTNVSRADPGNTRIAADGCASRPFLAAKAQPREDPFPRCQRPLS